MLHDVIPSVTVRHKSLEQSETLEKTGAAEHPDVQKFYMPATLQSLFGVLCNARVSQ